MVTYGVVNKSKKGPMAEGLKFRSKASFDGYNIRLKRRGDSISKISKTEAERRGVVRFWPYQEDEFESIYRMSKNKRIKK